MIEMKKKYYYSLAIITIAVLVLLLKMLYDLGYQKALKEKSEEDDLILADIVSSLDELLLKDSKKVTNN